jgi:hypothetical protein
MWPKVNERRLIDGTWNQILVTEYITVPAVAPYIVRLSEIPDDGTVNEAPVIFGLTLVEDYPPINSTDFYCNYVIGDLVFDSSQAGNSFSVIYWMTGSLIDATDINYLYNRSGKRYLRWFTA